MQNKPLGKDIIAKISIDENYLKEIQQDIQKILDKIEKIKNYIIVKGVNEK